ncbi:MAG: hypothetical protein HYZ57_02220, partial [Acidobacteria bacterium]|nr:hypothetical protein [Acidobacteriota bacterium]
TPPPAATALAIDDVTNLRQELDNRPLKGAGYANGRAAVIDDTGSLEAVLGDPLDCVRVDGTAAPCGSGGLPGFIDGETPAGTTDSVNRTFTLSNLPSPINSLMLFRNGMLQHTTRDYTISGSTITFATGSTPQSGDAMQAWYRVSAGGAPSNFADGETPAGAVDGVNATFLLAAAPAPVSSLQLYRNGLLQKPGTDYTLSGNTVVFLPAAVPQAGDLLLSYYRY